MPSETAKIVRFHKIGGPEVLQLDELPIPEPAANEARLRVKAIGLNRAEVMFREDHYLVSPELPSKLGYEASGTVEAIGPNVDPSWLGKTASTVPGFSLNKYGVCGEVAIVPAQDLLMLGSEARMNTPAVAGGNWSWRAPENSWTEDIVRGMADLVEVTDRDNDPLASPAPSAPQSVATTSAMPAG